MTCIEQEILRGRFIARAKISIFTTLATSRHKQDTPPSQTHTPSIRIPRIQGAPIELEDSPTLFTESDLGEEPFFTSTGEHIVIKEVESPGEEGKEETLSHQPLIEEPKDSEETIMAEEVLDGEYSLFG